MMNFVSLLGIIPRGPCPIRGFTPVEVSVKKESMD